MDPRLLRFYTRELAHLRELGAEFAAQFPKLAPRLGMNGSEVIDPHVERLLEGAAFLAARVQLKLDAEFPRFTGRLLEALYANCAAPTPAMLVAQVHPDYEALPVTGEVVVPRGTAFEYPLTIHRARESGAERSYLATCHFRTTDEVRLLPLEIAAVRYQQDLGGIKVNNAFDLSAGKSALRVRFTSVGGRRIGQSGVDAVRLFFDGPDELAFRLHHLVTGSTTAVLLGTADQQAHVMRALPAARVEAVGFDDASSMVPLTKQLFRGFRLLHEYAAFPQRFLFADVCGLGKELAQVDADAFELVLVFDQRTAELETTVDAQCVRLHCVPAVNLFPKRAERAPLDGERSSAFHVVPDRTRPLDYEVIAIEKVVGYGKSQRPEQEFLPLNASTFADRSGAGAFFTVERLPRLLTDAERINGTRLDYVGSDVFISLVDEAEAPYSGDLRQLAVATLCSNRDLPLAIHAGTKAPLSLNAGVPAGEATIRKGPSLPRPALALGSTQWRLLSHLALSATCLTGGEEGDGAAQLRELLLLFCADGDAVLRRQIDGIRALRSTPSVRRIPRTGPIAFARGVEVSVVVDELAFHAQGSYLFGCVLERFFARSVALNAFVETVLVDMTGKVVHRWEPRWGARPML